MTTTKTVLIALGLVFGLSTLAGAAPRHNMVSGGYTSSSDIAGKAQQDRFNVSY
jgi:hypothetical protein